MYPVPTIPQLAVYSGRAEGSYAQYAMQALLESTIMFSALTEITDPSGLSSDDQLLALNGVLSMADYIYLRKPYAQVLANPMQSETIGSYSYSKVMAEVARNAAALEVTGEATGVIMFDLAVRLLSRRTRAGGVFSEAISMFDGLQGDGKDGHAFLWWDTCEKRMWVLGPEDRDQMNIPFDINAQVFPQDPGI
jgi:hypothetical protein